MLHVSSKIIELGLPAENKDLQAISENKSTPSSDGFSKEFDRQIKADGSQGTIKGDEKKYINKELSTEKENKSNDNLVDDSTREDPTKETPLVIENVTEPKNKEENQIAPDPNFTQTRENIGTDEANTYTLELDDSNKKFSEEFIHLLSASEKLLPNESEKVDSDIEQKTKGTAPLSENLRVNSSESAFINNDLLKQLKGFTGSEENIENNQSALSNKNSGQSITKVNGDFEESNVINKADIQVGKTVSSQYVSPNVLLTNDTTVNLGDSIDTEKEKGKVDNIIQQGNLSNTFGSSLALDENSNLVDGDVLTKLSKVGIGEEVNTASLDAKALKNATNTTIDSSELNVVKSEQKPIPTDKKVTDNVVPNNTLLEPKSLDNITNKSIEPSTLHALVSNQKLTSINENIVSNVVVDSELLEKELSENSTSKAINTPITKEEALTKASTFNIETTFNKETTQQSLASNTQSSELKPLEVPFDKNSKNNFFVPNSEPIVDDETVLSSIGTLSSSLKEPDSIEKTILEAKNHKELSKQNAIISENAERYNVNNTDEASGNSLDSLSISDLSVDDDIIIQSNKIEQTILKSTSEQILTSQINDSVHSSNITERSFNDALTNVQNNESLSNRYVSENVQQNKLNVSQQIETININDKNFSESVKEKVLFAINQKLQRIDIQLDPPELGNVHVRVNLQNEVAAVNFIVQQQQTKDSLEQHMDKLKDMLADSGVDLGDANVEQEQKGNDSDNNSKGQFNSNESTEVISNNNIITGAWAKDSPAGVDFYA